MRQVRWVVCTLILGGVLGIAPMGSAQSLTFVTIDPSTSGNVWATGIAAGTTTTASCSEADKEQDDQQQEAECEDGENTATSTSTSTQVVGYSLPQNTSYRWVANTFTPIVIPVAGALGVFANGINGVGHVVGFYYDSAGKSHGFLQAGTSFTTIDAPSGVYGTVCTGINATDQIVGYYYDTAFKPHGFLYAGGTFTTLDFLGAGAYYSYATGINGLGQVVGYYYGTTGFQGWLMTGGAMSQIAVAGAFETKPHGINASGVIVGEFRDAARHWHGFRLASGVVTVVDIPNSTSSLYTAVNAISDTGEVSGEYQDSLSPRQLGFKMP